MTNFREENILEHDNGKAISMNSGLAFNFDSPSFINQNSDELRKEVANYRIAHQKMEEDDLNLRQQNEINIAEMNKNMNEINKKISEVKKTKNDHATSESEKEELRNNIHVLENVLMTKKSEMDVMNENLNNLEHSMIHFYHYICLL